MTSRSLKILCGFNVALFVLALLSVCNADSHPVVVPPTKAMPQAGQRYLGLDGSSAPQDPSPDVAVRWEDIGSFPVIAIHMGNIPGTDKYLYVQRNIPTKLEKPEFEVTAGILDLATRSWVNVSLHNGSNAFCQGQAPTATGQLIGAGGHAQSLSGMAGGAKAVRLLHVEEASLEDVTQMAYNRLTVGDEHPHYSTCLSTSTYYKWHCNRWYPTVILMPNRKLFIIGGTVKTNENAATAPVLEIYDPEKLYTKPQKFPLSEGHLQFAGKNFYPFTYVLPTGHIFTMIDRQSRFFTQSGEYVLAPSGKELAAPECPGNIDSGFPRTATGVMLALSHHDGYGSVEVMVFGGQRKGYTCPHEQEIANSTLASRYSYRLKISWAREDHDSDWMYSFSEWVEEDMGLSRVGGESVLLPNGDVIILSGAQTGCMGGTLKGINRANYPTLWPVLYQPDAEAGQRYTILKASRIARIYHHTAGLTRDGTILVAGCDACFPNIWLESSADFWSPSPTKRAEYRNEIFHTPYSLDTANRPVIKTVEGKRGNTIVNLMHGKRFNINWDAEKGAKDVHVTGVVLVAPTTTTHSFNTNQRVVLLDIASRDDEAKTMTVKLPHNANVVPPQYYLLFVLNGKTYSKARWVIVG